MVFTGNKVRLIFCCSWLCISCASAQMEQDLSGIQLNLSREGMLITELPEVCSVLFPAGLHAKLGKTLKNQNGWKVCLG